jgi:P-type Cu+ transporter
VTQTVAELDLVVEELCCADERAQIEAALGRLPAVRNVRTSLAAHKVSVRYDPTHLAPGDIEAAIARLGMTARRDQAPPTPSSTTLPRLLGGVFVAAVALIALIGIVGERLGLVEAVLARIPTWLTLSAVLIGGFPIFRNVVHALRQPHRGEATPPRAGAPGRSRSRSPRAP